MSTAQTPNGKPAEPKPEEALIAQYRAIGPASLLAALVCANGRRAEDERRARAEGDRSADAA